MINYSPLLKSFAQDKNEKINNWAKSLPQDINKGLCTQRHGDLPIWLESLDLLNGIKASVFELTENVSIGKRNDLTDDQFQIVEQAFKNLIPWRKGPYTLFDKLYIDTEWRSDWKWNRVKPHFSSLKDRKILDVGCGNGYHALRMLGEGAQSVLGIDPSPRFVVQFYMLKHLLSKDSNQTGTQDPVKADVLPLGIEQLPNDLNYFDTCFSMGVLYHRRSPMDHLLELKQTLSAGGELILETLIIDGTLGEALVPEGRYAKMRNVWFLPTVPTLISWLTTCGFVNARCVDIDQTSINEQRATDWMRFQSLSDFLDPNDHNKTAEGHPAPKRAVFIAHKPN